MQGGNEPVKKPEHCRFKDRIGILEKCSMDVEQKERIIEECRELMSRSKYDELKTEQFCSTISDILQEIIDHPDEQRDTKPRSASTALISE